MLKFIRIFLLILIIVGLGLLATRKQWVPVLVDWILKNEQNTSVQIPAETTLPQQFADGTYCFAYAHTATPEAPYAVEEHITLTKTGEAIQGTKTGTQSGPDMTNGYSGTLSGSVVKGSTTIPRIEAVYTYTIEGSSQKEKELYDVVGQVLVKLRYQLKESGDMLIPDFSTDHQRQVYVAEQCK